jgi:hypothetical protein
MRLQSPLKWGATGLGIIGVSFDWHDPGVIERDGHGRYRFNVGYLPSHPLLPWNSGLQQPRVELSINVPEKSRFVDVNPTPTTGSTLVKTWVPPVGQSSSAFDGVIENERTRAWVNLLAELVFLGAGAMIGAIAGTVMVHESEPRHLQFPAQERVHANPHNSSSSLKGLWLLALFAIVLGRAWNRRRTH